MVCSDHGEGGLIQRNLGSDIQGLVVGGEAIKGAYEDEPKGKAELYL